MATNQLFHIWFYVWIFILPAIWANGKDISGRQMHQVFENRIPNARPISIQRKQFIEQCVVSCQIKKQCWAIAFKYSQCRLYNQKYANNQGLMSEGNETVVENEENFRKALGYKYFEMNFLVESSSEGQEIEVDKVNVEQGLIKRKNDQNVRQQNRGRRLNQKVIATTLSSITNKLSIEEPEVGKFTPLTVKQQRITKKMQFSRTSMATTKPPSKRGRKIHGSMTRGLTPSQSRVSTIKNTFPQTTIKSQIMKSFVVTNTTKNIPQTTTTVTNTIPSATALPNTIPSTTTLAPSRRSYSSTITPSMTPTTIEATTPTPFQPLATTPTTFESVTTTTFQSATATTTFQSKLALPKSALTYQTSSETTNDLSDSSTKSETLSTLFPASISEAPSIKTSENYSNLEFKTMETTSELLATTNENLSTTNPTTPTATYLSTSDPPLPTNLLYTSTLPPNPTTSIPSSIPPLTNLLTSTPELPTNLLSASTLPPNPATTSIPSLTTILLTSTPPSTSTLIVLPNQPQDETELIPSKSTTIPTSSNLLTSPKPQQIIPDVEEINTTPTDLPRDISSVIVEKEDPPISTIQFPNEISSIEIANQDLLKSDDEFNTSDNPSDIFLK